MILTKLHLDFPEFSRSMRAHSAASFLFCPKVSVVREGDIVNLGPEGNPGWAWVSTEEAILDGDTFSFPEHCGGQHQQQEPRQPARLVLWNENTLLLLLPSGVLAVWAPCLGLACLSCLCGSSWPGVGATGCEQSL